MIPPVRHTDIRFDAIGTQWSIEIDGDWEGDRDALELTLRQRIALFDGHYSRFRGDSLVSRMARAGGTYDLPADCAPMLDMYRRLYDMSDGSVTPLIGQALSDAGYDAAYSFKPGQIDTVPAWEDTFELHGNRLHMKRPAILDFGAIGKGYLVDLLSGILDRAGVHTYCLDAGGDMRHRDAAGSAISVGLEHPADATQAIGIARLGNRSLCGSAGNRRAWRGFTHILDARSLRSPHRLRAVWAVADTTMLADGMSTALYFVPPRRLRQEWDFEFAIVEEDGRLWHSDGFPAEFFV